MLRSATPGKSRLLRVEMLDNNGNASIAEKIGGRGAAAPAETRARKLGTKRQAIRIVGAAVGSAAHGSKVPRQPSHFMPGLRREDLAARLGLPGFPSRQKMSEPNPW